MSKRNVQRKSWILVESGLCIALATVLSLITLFKMPLGGSVTPFATLPIIVISLRHGGKWGMASALGFSAIQLLLGMSNIVAVPVQTFWHMALCALLDYVLAYALLGFAGPVARRFNNSGVGIVAGVAITGLGRLACSFFSGIVIWGPYAREGWNIAVYSLAYNAAWCLPDVAITLVACLLLARTGALSLFQRSRPTMKKIEE